VKLNTWWTTLLWCMATAAPAWAQPLVVQDARGQSLSFAATPQRIVSLLPSLTETVCALGACQRLVGVDRWSNWPAEVNRLPRLGGLDDVQIEAIARLKPDLVLAANAARSLERLEALGLPVLRLRSETHADVQHTLHLVAGLLGQPGQGARAWAHIEAQVAAAAAQVPPGLRGRRVYFELGGGPYAAGSGSFIGETLARLGMGNIVPTALGPFPKLNPEFVLRAQPDVVMGAAKEAPAMAGRAGWQALRALQTGQQCRFSSEQYETLTRPGPRLGESAGVLADCLARLAPTASAAASTAQNTAPHTPAKAAKP
jgi:iron complex transport system substrate-binding protein